MNSPTESDAVRGNPIHLHTRLLVYLAVWLLAALAIQVFLQPEGLTVTFLTPSQQRVEWLLFTPFMVYWGLEHHFSLPQYSFWLFVAIVIAHGIQTLRCTQFLAFAVLIGLQVVTVASAVVFFIQRWRLPVG